MMLSVMLACEHKELYNGLPYEMDARVVFDWREAPDANPASMSLYLFPVGGGDVLRYDFTDRKGGTFRAPAGSYSVVCLNSDTENIRYRDARKRETFCVTTQEATWASGYAFMKNIPEAGAEPVMLPPDMIWSDYLERVELNRESLRTITLYPKVSVCHYTIEVRNAENLKYVSGVGGMLSSLASGLFAGRTETTDERVTIPFDGVISDDKTVVTGELLTFGQSHSKHGTHWLTIQTVLSDGSMWEYKYDVTDQVHKAPDSRNVYIRVDGLPVPKPITNGGGFRPSVDDWKTENRDIEM